MIKLKEAIEIDKWRIFCVNNGLAGQLWVHDKLFRKAMKVIKRSKK